jgi:hypothetical protein
MTKDNQRKYQLSTYPREHTSTFEMTIRYETAQALFHIANELSRLCDILETKQKEGKE